MNKDWEVIFSDRLLIGECPTWDHEANALWFVDIDGKCFFRMDYATGKCERFALPQKIGCLALCKNGDQLLAMEDGIYRRTPDGALTLAHQPIEIKGNRFNDGKVGPDGCFYVGTTADRFSGAFYRLAGNELTELFGGCGCSNGLDWSSDAKTMFYADTLLHKVERFAFSVDAHAPSMREPLLPVEAPAGGPDGFTVDAEGNLWVAVWGGYCVKHIDGRTGQVLDEIRLPVKKVSSCCFAGEDLRDLIITTASIGTDASEQPLAGSIFRVRTDVPGVKCRKF